MATQFLTPVGRLVQGDPMTPQTTDQAGKPLVTQSGQPRQSYFVAVAFPKTDPHFPALREQIYQVARASFPALFDAAGNCTHPRFSFKIVDGDGIDDNGKPNANKEGFAGHWVVKFASSFAPRCFYAGKYAPHEQIADANAIQRGYYVRVAGTIEGNGQAQRPGVYVNLGMIELVAVGDVITSGPDAAAVFGAAPAPALPAGATPLPSVGATPPPPAPVAPDGLPNHPSPAAAAVPPPPLPVAPNPAILTPPAPPVHQMTPAAQGHSYEALIAQGWTDETLRAQGLML